MKTLNRLTEEDTHMSEKVMMQLYKDIFPKVAGYISKRGGTLEEAKDVFQDALIIYYERTQNNEQTIKQSTKAYLFGIVKHLWIHQFKLGVNYEPLDDKIEKIESTSYQYISDKRLALLLQNAGEKCMELLKTFYYDKLSMTKVAERFGFTSKRSATVQKFKCLEKVRGFIKENSLQYEDFIE